MDACQQCDLVIAVMMPLLSLSLFPKPPPLITNPLALTVPPSHTPSILKHPPPLFPPPHAPPSHTPSILQHPPPPPPLLPLPDKAALDVVQEGLQAAQEQKAAAEDQTSRVTFEVEVLHFQAYLQAEMAPGRFLLAAQKGRVEGRTVSHLLHNITTLTLDQVSTAIEPNNP